MDPFREQIVGLCHSNECYAENFGTTYNGITGLQMFRFYRIFLLRHLLIFLVPGAIIISIVLRYLIFAINTMDGFEEFSNIITLKTIFFYIALPLSVVVNIFVIKKIAPRISIYRYDGTAYFLFDRVWFYFIYLKSTIWGKPSNKNSGYKLLSRNFYLYEIRPKGIFFHEDLYKKLKAEFEMERVTVDLINLFTIFSSRVQAIQDPYINKAVKQYAHLFDLGTNSFVMITDSNKADFEGFVDYLWENHYKEDEQYISDLIGESLKKLSNRKRNRLLQNIQSNPVNFNLFKLTLENN